MVKSCKRPQMHIGKIASTGFLLKSLVFLEDFNVLMNSPKKNKSK